MHRTAERGDRLPKRLAAHQPDLWTDHGMTVQHHVETLDRASDSGMWAREVSEDPVPEGLPGAGQKLALDLQWFPIGKGMIIGADRRPLMGPQGLVGGHHVTQGLTVVDDVVPRQRSPRAVGGQGAQMEIGYEPRGIPKRGEERRGTLPPRAVQPGRNEHRTCQDDLPREQADRTLGPRIEDIYRNPPAMLLHIEDELPDADSVPAGLRHVVHQPAVALRPRQDDILVLRIRNTGGTIVDTVP
jgi:hypothetical protein